MTINEVPEVVIDPSGGRKFIVARLTDDNGVQRLVVRANEKCDFHVDILDQLANEIKLSSLRARCIGGGVDKS